MEATGTRLKGRLLLVLWAALVSFLIIDPLASTGIAAKGMALWNRLTNKG